MKKNLFYLFALICSMSLFTACSDDDDDNKALTVNDIVGTYAGSLDVAGTAVPNTSIYVTKESDSKVTIELKNFSFGPITIGDIKVEGCDVKANGSKLDIDGENEVTISLGTFPVVVDGDSDGKTLKMSIKITGTPGLGDITVGFTGNK